MANALGERINRFERNRAFQSHIPVRTTDFSTTNIHHAWEMREPFRNIPVADFAKDYALKPFEGRLLAMRAFSLPTYETLRDHLFDTGKYNLAHELNEHWGIFQGFLSGVAN